MNRNEGIWIHHKSVFEFPITIKEFVKNDELDYNPTYSFIFNKDKGGINDNKRR